MNRQFTNDITGQIKLATVKGVTIWQEIANIAKDVYSGALPLTEVFSFLFWRLTGK